MKSTEMNDNRIHLFGEFTLDLARGCLTRSGEPVHLRPQSYAVLKYLVEHKGRLISKDQLIEEAWNGRAVTDGSLSKCIEEVREVLGPGARQYIRNVRGRGYIFDPGVHEDDSHIEVDTRATPPNGESESNEIVVGPSDRTFELSAVRNHRRLAMMLAAAAIVGVVVFEYVSHFGNHSSPIRSIAVLPFSNASGEPNMEYLSDGISESVTNSLSQLAGLSVMSRNSVYRYKGRDMDAHSIGRDLGVQAVLTGRVVSRGDDVAISVELVNSADNTHIWGEHYNRKINGLATLHREIARDISRRLHTQLSTADEQRLAKDYVASAEAYELYLKGRYHHFKLTLEELRQGIAFYQEAINSDPSYALAYAGMAEAYRALAIAGWGVPSKEAFPQAKAAAIRALDIDPDLADAHTAVGWIAFSYDWDWNAAEREFKRAIELNPNNSDAHRGYGHLFSVLGRGNDAIAESRRARELDPLSLITNALEGQFLFYAGHDDEAITRFRKTLEIDPDFWIAHNGIARVYIRQGRLDEAIAELTKNREAGVISNEPITQLAYALATSGRLEQARAILTELKSSATQDYIPAYSFAMIHNGFGDKEQALRYLQRSFEEREVQIIFLKIDTRWDNYRADPRFQDLMRRIGLPQ